MTAAQPPVQHTYRPPAEEQEEYYYERTPDYTYYEHSRKYRGDEEPYHRNSYYEDAADEQSRQYYRHQHEGPHDGYDSYSDTYNKYGEYERHYAYGPYTHEGPDRHNDYYSHRDAPARYYHPDEPIETPDNLYVTGAVYVTQWIEGGELDVTSE